MTATETQPNSGLVYNSNATPKQQEQKRALLTFQLSMIKDQVEWGIAADEVTVKCGCHNKVRLVKAYKCLYCGVWYCKECAQEHFGYKV